MKMTFVPPTPLVPNQEAFPLDCSSACSCYYDDDEDEKVIVKTIVYNRPNDPILQKDTKRSEFFQSMNELILQDEEEAWEDANRDFTQRQTRTRGISRNSRYCDNETQDNLRPDEASDIEWFYDGSCIDSIQADDDDEECIGQRQDNAMENDNAIQIRENNHESPIHSDASNVEIQREVSLTLYSSTKLNKNKSQDYVLESNVLRQKKELNTVKSKDNQFSKSHQSNTKCDRNDVCCANTERTESASSVSEAGHRIPTYIYIDWSKTYEHLYTSNGKSSSTTRKKSSQTILPPTEIETTTKKGNFLNVAAKVLGRGISFRITKNVESQKCLNVKTNTRRGSLRHVLIDL